MQYIPVRSTTGQLLMPCHAARARQLLRHGKACKRFDRGLCYLQLIARESGAIQPIAVGLDPGSKKEAYTVKSAHHTYLNMQADAVTWTQEAVETRRQMRRARRYRKTPYRRCRSNRLQGHIRLAPSTRARWGWKLRLCRWLARLYPLTTFVVEDVGAATRPGKRRWNRSFSMLEVGKLWFYTHLAEIAPLVTRPGHYTAALRDALGLQKIRLKLSDRFEAHCVDSWVLANFYTGGHLEPDNTSIMYLVPLRFHRRQLHRLQPEHGGRRKPYGGTMSLGLKRGSWVRHARHGVCYLGGTTGNTISLHRMQDGRRIAKVLPATVQVLCTASWRVRRRQRGFAS
jgi:RRXRR protein